MEEPGITKQIDTSTSENVTRKIVHPGSENISSPTQLPVIGAPVVKQGPADQCQKNEQLSRGNNHYSTLEDEQHGHEREGVPQDKAGKATESTPNRWQ